MGAFELVIPTFDQAQLRQPTSKGDSQPNIWLLHGYALFLSRWLTQSKSEAAVATNTIRVDFPATNVLCGQSFSSPCASTASTGDCGWRRGWLYSRLQIRAWKRSEMTDVLFS